MPEHYKSKYDEFFGKSVKGRALINDSVVGDAYILNGILGAQIKSLKPKGRAFNKLKPKAIVKK